jgi:hypothetical protein
MARLPVSFHDTAYSFVVDTGSRYTSFDSKLASLLVITSADSSLIDVHRAARVSLYRSPTGKIGGLALRSLEPVWCFDHKVNDHLASKVHGCLGIDAMRDLIIRIDYDRGRIALLRSVPRDAGVRLQLDVKNACPAVRGEVGGLTRTFLLDTGGISYGAGLIAKRDVDELASVGALSVVEKLPLKSDFGSSLQRAAILSAPLVLGSFQHLGLAVSEFEGNDMTMNVLGVGYLRRYMVTFDFPRRAVYLAPGAQFRKIDASHDPGGLMLHRDEGRVVVSAVAGPAEKAGVAVGDALHTVNGLAAASLDDISLAQLLSRSDAPVALVLRRQDGGLRRFDYDPQAARRHAAGDVPSERNEVGASDQRKSSPSGRLFRASRQLKEATGPEKGGPGNGDKSHY